MTTINGEGSGTELDIEDFPKADADRGFQVTPREQARTTLALRLLWLIAFLSTSLTVATIFGYIDSETAKDIAGVLITPITAIFGTVIGFYFGSGNSHSTKG